MYKRYRLKELCLKGNLIIEINNLLLSKRNFISDERQYQYNNLNTDRQIDRQIDNRQIERYIDRQIVSKNNNKKKIVDSTGVR